MSFLGRLLGTKRERTASIEDLTRAGDVPGLIDVLRGDLRDAGASARVGAAVHALVHLDVGLVKDHLIHALDDPNATVRRGAIMALAGRGDDEVQAALARRLDDPDKGNRDLAHWALTGGAQSQ